MSDQRDVSRDDVDIPFEDLIPKAAPVTLHAPELESDGAAIRNHLCDWCGKPMIKGETLAHIGADVMHIDCAADSLEGDRNND